MQLFLGQDGKAFFLPHVLDLVFLVVEAVFHPLFDRLDTANRADSRQSPQPVGKQDEEEYRQDKGQESPARVTCAAGNAVSSVIEELDDDFEEILEAGWHFTHAARREPRNQQEHEPGRPQHHRGVHQVERAQPDHLFGGKLDQRDWAAKETAAKGGSQGSSRKGNE